MANELIRLDTAIIGIDSLINKASTAKEAKMLFTVKDIIYNQQRYSADVQPVKHGKWIDNGIVYTCSECNSSVPKKIFVIGCDFEGCPYCFARMDGDSKC